MAFGDPPTQAKALDTARARLRGARWLISYYQAQTGRQYANRDPAYVLIREAQKAIDTARRAIEELQALEAA